MMQNITALKFIGNTGDELEEEEDGKELLAPSRLSPLAPREQKTCSNHWQYKHCQSAHKGPSSDSFI